MSQYFITRPVFAAVISILIMIVGLVAYGTLPSAQYPEVAPPTIVVTASYPGATPEVVAQTVAAPLEQEINGVEDMLYMESQCTADGNMTLTVTFQLGTDLDTAQVLVQNRVAIAEPRLPQVVRQIGLTTRKTSPDLLMVIHMVSPEGTFDQLYISNYALLQVRDVLSRIDGVGDVRLFGAREYSMRIWLNPERLSALNITATEVVDALQAQNVQVAAGVVGQAPVASGVAFQLPVSTVGRLSDPEEFEQIVIRTGENGRIVRVRDVANVELASYDYSVNSYLSGETAVAMVIFQRPGSNALATAERVQQEMKLLGEAFPPGLEYRIIYNPTEFIAKSVDAVYHTIFEAAILVVLVITVFLQNWRVSIIPLLAIPVSLIGTFAVMALLGLSLNNLSLFGLVLAIGIVVDDAIVVVENIERLVRDGMKPLAATRKAMKEVSGALVAMGLVLVSVFIPTAFLGGISGQFYQQFGLTIAVSTMISVLVSLTLSPALSAILIQGEDEKQGLFTRIWNKLLGGFFRLFNRVFEKASNFYASAVRGLLRVWPVSLVVYVALLGLTWLLFTITPTGFVPAQDQGYAIVAVQLPPGASLERTEAVVQEVTRILLENPGIDDAVAFVGWSGATRTNASNAAALFPVFKPFEERTTPELSGNAIIEDIRRELGQIRDGMVFVIPPPPVRGVGSGGGFKLYVQDRKDLGFPVLEAETQKLAGAANAVPGLVGVFSPFSASSPQLFADIDRTKAQMLDVPLSNIFDALQIYLGSTYVNDFNLYGRVYRVTAQAKQGMRDDAEDLRMLKTRSRTGAAVPLSSVMELKTITAPDRVVRYNLFPAASINGDTLPGYSSGQSIAEMEKLARENLPQGLDIAWTDLAFQQKLAGGTGMFIFVLSVIFVYLQLAAQYESWSLPLAVILIVPMCLLFAILGVMIRGMDNNILTQIGLVVLVALACKNAILIVEFAKQQQEAGKNRFDAAVEAARLRLRPILMTAFAFILGVVPLVIASGPGAEMRQALGTAVFAGMLGVTMFGLFLTPVFYYVIQWIIEKGWRDGKKVSEPSAPKELPNEA